MRVSPVGRDELDAVAALLARAFTTQPLITFLLGPGRGRERALIFRAEARDAMRAGAVEAVRVDGRLGAVAVWLAPGAHPVPPGRMARMLPAWAALALLDPRAVPRLVRAPPVLDRLHPPEPHWFLALLGTEPSLWGRGLGAALVEHGLARARRERVPAHLDTDSERNVAWYERLGFSVTERVHVMPGAPPSWGMRADP